MLTINAYTVTLTTRPRTLTTIGRSYAADEPSHIHIPRPIRVMRSDTEAQTNHTTRITDGGAPMPAWTSTVAVCRSSPSSQA